jgi:hypothetical protein
MPNDIEVFADDVDLVVSAAGYLDLSTKTARTIVNEVARASEHRDLEKALTW